MHAWFPEYMNALRNNASTNSHPQVFIVFFEETLRIIKALKKYVDTGRRSSKLMASTNMSDQEASDTNNVTRKGILWALTN